MRINFETCWLLHTNGPLTHPSPLRGEYPFSVPSASFRHSDTMRDANNTPNQSVAADVSRLKLDPRPARNGRLRNRSDPAHAGCYKREWKSTRATGQGAIAGSTIGVAFKPMLNRYEVLGLLSWLRSARCGPKQT